MRVPPLLQRAASRDEALWILVRVRLNNNYPAVGYENKNGVLDEFEQEAFPRIGPAEFPLRSTLILIGDYFAN